MSDIRSSKHPALLLIAQRLNSSGSRSVHDAIQRQDAAVIAEIARRQARAGAHYVDVNAAAWGVDREPEALRWLVQTVQAATDIPFSLDSVNPEALRLVLPLCKRPPLLNSFSGAANDQMLALVREWPGLPIVAVCHDGQGTRTGVNQRLAIAARLAGQLQACGVGEENIILDPVTLPSSCGPVALKITLQTMRRLRQEFPQARVLGVPGNFSYGAFQRRKAEREYAKCARVAGAAAFLCDVQDSLLLACLGVQEPDSPPICAIMRRELLRQPRGFPKSGDSA